MIFTPFDNEDVIASVADGVVDLVVVVADVFHKDFIARSFGSINSDKKKIGT